MVKKILNSHKSIIFLNGDFSKIFNINMNATLIAADGASNKMKKQNIFPHFIIGDGDSSKNSNEMIYINDQDTTDFEKCLLFVKLRNLFPALILGMTGGEIDHILGNAQVFLRYSHFGSLYFIDSNTSGTKLGVPLVDSCSLELHINTLISIIPFQEAIISSKGLVWELLNTKISVDNTLPLRNRTRSNQIDIQIHSGKAIIILDISAVLIS